MQYEDILGQKEIKKQLQQTIAENRVSHAQLFLGPEGSGALPMALAYATEILCTNTNKNKRASFLKCQKLAHPDLHLVFPTNTTTLVKKNAIYKAFQAEFREAVFENPYLSLNQWLGHLGIGNKQGSINVASSQEIIRDISLKPFESDYKVVIFWMVEKLHPSASNKLLKILEEPPAKTTFILIAENPELLRTFLEVTEESNVAWKATDAQIAKVSADAGMDIPTTKNQMAGFIFPTAAEQITEYFGNNGIAGTASESLGLVFKKSNVSNLSGSLTKTIDGSYLQ